jgi:ABC-2 type transport system ATP-binding protein
MPERFGLYRQMTVFECLDFFGAGYGMAADERESVIADILKLTDMTGRRDDLINNLSRGMVQRLSLARALVHDPDLLLLDEPAAGLDPRARLELMAVLGELSRMGKTVFISSHILGEIAELCDSVTVIDRGRIKYSGSMRDLLAQRTDGGAYVLTLAAQMTAVQKALENAEGVVRVVAEDDGRTYRVGFDPEATDTAAVLRSVIDAGGRVTAWREDLRELSHVFLELTEPGVPS